MRSGTGITGYSRSRLNEWRVEDSVQVIEAPGNYEIKVDKWYYDRNCLYDWRVNRQGYAYRRCEVSGKRIWMSRDVLGVSGSCVVDHINGDTLDNRESNLRACSTAENSYNKGKVNGDGCTSKFKGVSKRGNKWIAAVSMNGMTVRLGSCSSEAEAALRYDSAAVYLFGKFARINFEWNKEKLLEEARRL